MFGTRSPQTEPMAHGVPSETDQSTAPVAASSPYTQSFSVVTMTVEPTTRIFRLARVFGKLGFHFVDQLGRCDAVPRTGADAGLPFIAVADVLTATIITDPITAMQI